MSLNIYGADGALVRQLIAGKAFSAGDHAVEWDGKVNGKPLPAGEYTWRALFRGDLGLSSRGCIGDFGGDRGPPSAAAADDSQVYLGWSLATADGDAVVACDPGGKILWTHRRGALSGCRALSVDGGLLFVLGGAGADAEGRAIYRLNTKDGTVSPWPDGRIDLELTTLWPAKGNYKPGLGDYLAAKNGRIYLSFTSGQFIAVLDAKSGKYLQTIVGAPPGPVDAAPTKSDAPDKPGSLIDSDFVVTALKGGAIGTLLLAHDPIWVLASDLTPLDGGERIAALAMIGDGAPYHARDIFVGLGRPLNQVQARPALDTESVTYVAGKAGGRAANGPWEPDRMGDIRGLALDGTGQLWVAEGDSVPRRVSVWSTDSGQGRLVREFFAPPDPGSPVVVDPLDPALFYAGGCEWRIERKTGSAACLGVITHEPVRAARFATEKGRLLLVLTQANGTEQVFERFGDGDYRKQSEPAPGATPRTFQLVAMPDGKWHVATSDGFDVGTLFAGPGSALAQPPAEASLTESADGRVFVVARLHRLWIFELAGLGTVRPLAAGRITLP